VFKLSQDGTETVLHSFFNSDCSDGRFPIGGLVADTAGNLYGTTYTGGGSGCLAGCGVVFRVSAVGIFTVLHSFTGFPTDGGYSQSALIADASGILYGTTEVGGASCTLNVPAGCGTVFKLVGTGVRRSSRVCWHAGKTELPWPERFRVGQTIWRPSGRSRSLRIPKCRSASGRNSGVLHRRIGVTFVGGQLFQRVMIAAASSSSHLQQTPLWHGETVRGEKRSPTRSPENEEQTWWIFNFCERR